jgi:hypothetical protein
MRRIFALSCAATLVAALSSAAEKKPGDAGDDLPWPEKAVESAKDCFKAENSFDEKTVTSVMKTIEDLKAVSDKNPDQAAAMAAGLEVVKQAGFADVEGYMKSLSQVLTAFACLRAAQGFEEVLKAKDQEGAGAPYFKQLSETMQTNVKRMITDSKVSVADLKLIHKHQVALVKAMQQMSPAGDKEKKDKEKGEE